MEKGTFITFEGIDGCGKSTQIAMLEEYLSSKGEQVVKVREPGGTVVGEKIREILLSKKNDSMTPMAELLLFVAARAQITEEVIKPAIGAGKTVICDRFFDSTFAYQGYARDMGTDRVMDINLAATGGLTPDITFVLDLTPEQAFARRNERDGGAEDRMEALGLSFQEKVREGYLLAAKKYNRIRLIDASGTKEQIASDIREAVEKIRRGS